MSDTYQPLKEERGEIRLLRVKAAGSEDTIQCWLSTVSLFEDSHLQYETISYCWENPANRSQLYLNNRLVSVPRSSERALRRVRLVDEDRTVWIDALCINQEDLVEKSIQVRLMGIIYRRGFGNLIFLGNDEEGVAENTVGFLRQATLNIEDLASTLSDEERSSLIRKGEWPTTLAEEDVVIKKAQLEQLQPLFSLSWFERLWVIQEACLSPKNTCFWGSQRFMLHDALRIVSIGLSVLGSLITRDPIDSHISFVNASVFWKLFDLRPPDNSIKCSSVLDALMYVSQTRLSTDDRDRVFAVNALYSAVLQSQNDCPMGLPDYQKSTRDVFRDATRNLLMVFGDAVLSGVGIDGGSSQYPDVSWAVNWTAPKRAGIKITASAAGVDFAKRGSISTLSLHSVPNDPDVLCLQGFVVGSVLWTTPPNAFKQISSLNDSFPLLLTYALDAARVEHKAEDQSFYQLAGRILFRGAADDIFDTDMAKKERILTWIGLQIQAFAKCLQEEGRDIFMEQLRTQGWDTFGVIASFCEGRSLFKMEGNFCGNGPDTVRTGDQVVIFKGGLYAHVVRPVKNYSVLIGQAYIPGLMEGEIFGTNVQLQQIRIR